MHLKLLSLPIKIQLKPTGYHYQLASMYLNKAFAHIAFSSVTHSQLFLRSCRIKTLKRFGHKAKIYVNKNPPSCVAVVSWTTVGEQNWVKTNCKKKKKKEVGLHALRCYWEIDKWKDIHALLYNAFYLKDRRGVLKSTYERENLWC